MDQNHQLKLTQMKTHIQTLSLSSSTENYTDQTLTRFLIARSMDPNKAAKMFVSWRKWRASFVPLGVVPDSEVVDELEAKKIYLQGLSKEYGCPVVVCKAHKHYPAKDQPQFKKFVVHLLDKAIASGFKGKEIGDEKIIAILDLDQIGYNNVDARGFITGFQFLQMICQFLEKATLEKIVIISNEDEKNQFIKEVGEDVLPEEFGGHSSFVLLQDVVLQPLED